MTAESMRSRNMRSIRTKNTKPEMQIRRALHARGYRFRVSPKDIPGKPDLWFPGKRAAIFVNGCFWHAHGCHLFKIPKSNASFWHKKLTENVSRDARVQQFLFEHGIRVLVVWECAMRGKSSISPDLVAVLAATWLQSASKCGCITSKGLNTFPCPDPLFMIGTYYTV